MQTLAWAALVLGIGIASLWGYVRWRPPDTSAAGPSYLQRGLQLGIISSVALLVLYGLMSYRPLVSSSKVLPFVLCALAGNVLNLAAEYYCLREINGESLLATTFMLFNQLLWILYALLVLTTDF
jgi:hypothetical protein